MVDTARNSHAIDAVIEGGFCVGCGSCAAAAPDDFSMRFDAHGCWRAQASRPADRRARDISDLCPMSGVGPDETAIASALYPDLPHHPEIGAHAACWAGWVEEGEFRARGSSGGLLSWLATRLLTEGVVDAIIHVAPRDPEDACAPLFATTISNDTSAVISGAKSRYHPINIESAIEIIKKDNRRYCFVGLPCAVKAMRVFAQKDQSIQNRVPVMLGLICGHLKSRAFAEMLAWQKGMPPEKLAQIDYRMKIEGRPASRYGFRAEDRDGAVVTAPMDEVFGGDWGLGLFKLKACDYCDDVLAECADAAIGDAWLPEYAADWRGTNVAVLRSATVRSLVERGRVEGGLRLEPISPDAVAASQSSGLRHRREGLAFRLAQDDAAGVWRPRKRVEPSQRPPRRRRRIYAARVALRDASHRLFAEARASGDLDHFLDAIRPMAASYYDHYRPGRLQRARSRLRRVLDTLLGPAFRAARRLWRGA